MASLNTDSVHQYSINQEYNDSIIFNQLPKELITKIFSHLNPVSLRVASRICKKWSESTSESSIQKSIIYNYIK